MKINILLFFFTIFFTNIFSVDKSLTKKIKVINDTTFARFEYRLPEKSGKISIILYRDGSYKYSLNTHLYQHFSEGKWEISKNTLTLNSSIQKTELPISLITNRSSNDSEFIKIDWIRNRNQEILKEAVVLVNYDTTKHCMPAFDNDCKIRRNELRCIQVRLNNGIASKWYIIQPEDRFNRIKITVDLDFHTDGFIFFNNKKFKIMGNKLYETKFVEFNEMGTKRTKEVIDYTYYFKRVK